jgi:hypothetical protein
MVKDVARKDNMRNAYKILVRQSKGKRVLISRKYADNTVVDNKNGRRMLQ